MSWCSYAVPAVFFALFLRCSYPAPLLHRLVAPTGGGRAGSLYATPPPAPPPPKVLKDSWGVGRIRTGCGCPLLSKPFSVADMSEHVQGQGQAAFLHSVVCVLWPKISCMSVISLPCVMSNLYAVPTLFLNIFTLVLC